MKMFILLSFLQLSFCVILNASSRKSGALENTPKRTYPSNWTPSPLYYFINTSSGLDENPIKEALDRIQKESCFRFTKMNESNLGENMAGIRFINNSKCGTHLGKLSDGMLHTIFIGPNCSKESDVGKIQQLVGKALGMPDQHRRPDRNNYIIVNDTNLINDTYKSWLEIWNASMLHLYGIGYDFNSLFHWKSNVFRRPNDSTPTLNGKPYQYNAMMGQTEGFNFADYKHLNYHYCNKSYETMHGSMPNCSNSGYYDINSHINGTCKCPNGFTGNLCNNLRQSDSNCTNNKEYNATSSSQILSESGKKNCTYRIKSSNGKNISVTLTSVVTSNTTLLQKCMPENGFEIKYRNDKSPAGLCLCGNYSNITLTSDGGDVIVLYTGKNTTDSFNLTYVEK